MLAKDAFGHKVENVCEAAGLVCCAREVFDESGKMFHHFVVIGCIITGNAQDLKQQGKFQLNFLCIN